MNIDASAVIWSAPERERAGRPLIVLLHGYGSHEGDLFQLSPGLPLGPVVASVRAPVAENGGWAWFSLADRGLGNPDGDSATEAAETVLAWLDSLEFTSVALLGFSQGAIVALQALRLRPDAFTSIVALSGFAAGGTTAGDVALEAKRVPVFWGRGTLDRIIPAEAIARTETWLPEHSDLTAHIYEDLGHGVSGTELSDISAFLRAH